jgi:tetratricopeptide (TPR) repeat protein
MDDLQRRAENAEDAGDLPAALELWRERARGDGASIFLLRFGRVAEKLGKWDDAEVAFTEAIRNCPQSANATFRSLARLFLGILWLIRTDKDHRASVATAKEWFNSALEIKRCAPSLSLLGSACEQLGDLEGARAAFEEAIALDPEYEEAIYNLAVIEKKTNPLRARELLVRAIQLDPNRGSAHGLLGRICQKMKEPTPAEQHFRRALEIDPGDYWSALYLANLLGMLKRNSEAEQEYRNATQLRPDLAGGHEFFARFLERIGKFAEAAEEREKIPLSERINATKY